MKQNKISRRYFFYGSLLAGAVPAAGFGSVPSLARMGYKSLNEKLNIAMIGAGGRGAEDIKECVDENIVALADPDAERAASTFKQYEKVPRYADFRRMLDKEKSTIDAVIITTPDHMHATAAMWAMERGIHVYVEKPLTRTVWEANQLKLAAAKYKVASQMGNQGYSAEGARQACEIIWSGEIGNVTEVHAWTDRPIWPQGIAEVPPSEKVPDTMDWDVWLGIAEDRPYNKAYAPYSWRGYYDFGSGALGDMACHILGAPNMALMLGSPTSVEVVSQEGKNSYTFPSKSVIRFDFPARGTMAPMSLYWYDGVQEPTYRPEGIPEDELLIPSTPRPASSSAQKTDDARRRKASQGHGAVYVGDKGYMATDMYGRNVQLLPAARWKEYELPPQILTRSPGHFRDWFRACKGGEPSCSDFKYAGPFAEWILLGCIALRFEGKLEWDSNKMRFTNNSEANNFIKPTFRKGWSFT